MEVGAVKQAFNNEVIQLKRNLNQAKIQTIHKLTRKAKTLTGKKAPDKLKDKLKRKAESAVNEVLILKKIKSKDIAKFAVTHTGDLQDYLNKPTVDQDKACARLLLHKSLQEKYKFIRNTFSNIPINDLLMSRNERRKMKKEALEKQKMKKDKKQKALNAEGEWKVENLKDKKVKTVEQELSDDDEAMGSDDEAQSEGNENTDDERIDDDEAMGSDDEAQSEGNENTDDERIDDDDDKPSSGEEDQNKDSDDEVESKMEIGAESDNESDEDEEDSESENIGKFVRPNPVKLDNKTKISTPNQQEKNAKTLSFDQLRKNKNKPETKKLSKPKDAHKNKNLNEKLLSRKFKKDKSESKEPETKVVDPFFITSTGENYMSVVEPRQPDEVKEIHKQGNRKLRRAAMFGHVPKIKPRRDGQDNYSKHNGGGGFRNESRTEDGHSNYRGNSKFNRNDNTQFNRRDNSQFKGRNDSQFKGRNDSQFKGRNDSQFKSRNDSNFKGNDTKEHKVEKLHPSWEAKKKKSGILPFQGKKIVFDES